MNRHLTCRTLAAVARLTLAFAPFPLLAAAQDGEWREGARLGRGWMTDVAWSPDGDTVAVATFIGVWRYTADLETVDLLEGHGGPVWAVAWSPDGGRGGGPARLASGSHDGTVRIWEP